MYRAGVIVAVVVAILILVAYRSRAEPFYYILPISPDDERIRIIDYVIDDPYTGNSILMHRLDMDKWLVFVKPSNGTAIYKLGYLGPGEFSAPALLNGTQPTDAIWAIRYRLMPIHFYTAQGLTDMTVIGDKVRIPYVPGPAQQWNPVLRSAAKPYYRFAQNTIVGYGDKRYILQTSGDGTAPSYTGIDRLGADAVSRLYGKVNNLYYVPLTDAEYAALRAGANYDPDTIYWNPTALKFEVPYLRKVGNTIATPSAYSTSSISANEDDCANLSSLGAAIAYEYDIPTRKCTTKNVPRVSGVNTGILRPDGAWKVYENVDLPGTITNTQAASSDAQCRAYLQSTGGDFYTFNGSVCTLKRLPRAGLNPQTVVGLNVDTAFPAGYTPINNLPENKCYKGPESPAVYYTNSKYNVCLVRDQADYEKRCGPAWSSHTQQPTTAIIGTMPPGSVPLCGPLDTKARASRWRSSSTQPSYYI